MRILSFGERAYHKVVFANAILWGHVGLMAFFVVSMCYAVAVSGHRFFHFLLVCIIAGSQLLFKRCPLTLAESSLRQSRPDGFEGSFVVHYAHKWFGMRVNEKLAGFAQWGAFMFSTGLFVFPAIGIV